MLDKFWKWISESSVNPGQTALTVKGLIVGVIPVVVFFSGYLHLHILPDQIQAAADFASQAVEVILGIVAAGMTLFGLIRKVANLVRDVWSASKG